jgi:hypothetical protein
MIILLLGITSCDFKKANASVNRSQHYMMCVNVAYNLTRCENKEVICYYNYYEGGISCKFKEKK